MSIEKQSINAIKSLLARPDLDINEKSFHIKGNSQVEQKAALHLAAEIGNLEMIRLLLDKKDVDINIEDDQGKKQLTIPKIMKPSNYFQNDFPFILE